MRLAHRYVLVFLVLAAGSAFGQMIPSDAYQQCPTTNISSWFTSGSITLNGAVNPADSLTLNTDSNCNFYLWSAQMFLWMTSPSASIYGGNGRVFQSPVFYGVVQDGNNFYFVPQFFIPPFFPQSAAASNALKAPPKLPKLTGAKMMKQLAAALRPAKRGPHGLPTVIDRKGRTYEVLDAPKSAKGRPLVASRSGAQTEVSKVTVDENRHVTFFDAAGKKIAQPKPLLSARLQGAEVAQRFFTSAKSAVFVDSSGSALNVSPEQAGAIGAVLIAQNNNAVLFYTIAVNDVYAWFLTGVANGAINTNNQFPTSQSDLDQIIAYAGQYGVTFPDADALAMEVKMSWIDASTLPDPGDYITMPATIPVYNTSSSQSWPQFPNPKPATLALLGVHVVGSSTGHPEMLWGTFEHYGNSPNATYEYLDTSQKPKPNPQNTSGTWLLTSNGSKGPFNVARANYLTPPAITAQPCPSTAPPPPPPCPVIGPSDTLRNAPFGVAPVGVPNQNDPTPAVANTEVISINNNILGQLVTGDVRKNYYQLGTTWTLNGAPPTSPFPVGGNEIGTSYLSNSTMETYQQWDGTSNPGNNCLDCHQSTSTSIANTNVSHIFPCLAPLFGSPGTNCNTSSTAKPAMKAKKK